MVCPATPSSSAKATTRWQEDAGRKAADMRARLTYLMVSPSTPRRLARWTVNAGGLAGAALLLAGLSTGDVSHAVFSAMVAL